MSMKSVYVSEEDVTLWEQVGVIAARRRTSTSAIIKEALRRYLRDTAIEEAERHRATDKA